MSNFNNKIREKLRRNRLEGLRDRMFNGPFPIPLADFQTVFEDIDFVMINRMWENYKYCGQCLQKAGDLAPDLRPFVAASVSAAHKLNELHKQWRDLQRRKLDKGSRRMRERQLKEAHRGVLLSVKYLYEELPKLTPLDLERYIQRPVEQPEKPLDETMVKLWAFTDYECSRRYPWYYWWRDKYTANGLPTESVAQWHLTLWQLESHLGLPKRTGIERFDVKVEGWNWKPVFNV